MRKRSGFRTLPITYEQEIAAVVAYASDVGVLVGQRLDTDKRPKEVQIETAFIDGSHL